MDTDNDKIANSSDNCPTIAATSGNHPDSDGCNSNIDIDDDGDGLIEIRNLDELNNIRHALDGSGYATSSGGTKNTAGCGGKDDISVCSGYELTRSLDFNAVGSYAPGSTNSASWQANNANPDSANNAGWNPIGYYNNAADNAPFTATFEGNGFAISNLYIRRSRSIGFFGVIGNGALLRNIAIIDNKIYGTSNDRVGSLVGYQIGGAIMVSYATGDVDSGGGFDYVGGLVGQQTGGSITASYATGDVNNGGGHNNLVGGLVGEARGSIIASYATGNVQGVAANNDTVGGLVGQIGGSPQIIASYAIGDADGKNVGALVGHQSGGSIQQSYGFGTATGANGNTLGAPPSGVTAASGLTSSNAGTKWGTNESAVWDWDFGTSSQNPALKVNFDGKDPHSVTEFGGQGR